MTLTIISEPAHNYRFEVIDTGIGISISDQAKIFNPFQQGEQNAKIEGTGLGLAITQRHVELMGGELAVESTLGKGSRFFFTVSYPLQSQMWQTKPLSGTTSKNSPKATA